MTKRRRSSSKLNRVPARDQIPATHSTLAALFLQAFYDTGAMAKWQDLMFYYIHDYRNAIPRNRKDQASHRGNLQKELFKPDMTWGVFLKGMRFLGAEEFDIRIVPRMENGQRPILEATVNLGRRMHIPPDPETPAHHTVLTPEEEKEYLQQHPLSDDTPAHSTTYPERVPPDIR